MNSYLGYFLVASPCQLDPNFAGTVVLVGGHTRRAAFGLIVNGSVEQSKRLSLRNSRWRRPERAKLFLGGPVTGPLMIVHANPALGERQLLPGVFFSRKEKNVLALIGRAEQPCKIFAGYAGWGPGQLEYEVRQGTWRVVPATPEQIFSDGRDLWDRLSRQAWRMQFRTMFNFAHVNADPLLN